MQYYKHSFIETHFLYQRGWDGGVTVLSILYKFYFTGLYVLYKERNTEVFIKELSSCSTVPIISYDANSCYIFVIKLTN